MGKRKTYDGLTFTDDFMFREVMENHPEICQELAELLTGRLPKSDLTEAIDRAVRDQKEDERGRRKYMTLQEHYDIEHEDGVQEGIVRGRKEGRKEGIAAGQKQMSLVLKNLFDAGKTDEVEKALNDEDYLNKLITEFKDK